MSNSSKLSLWARAIAEFEGYFQTGSVADRNNNPGNLKYAGQRGATGQDARGFAIFPDEATGFAALERQLNLYIQRSPDNTLIGQTQVYLGQKADGPAQITVEGNPTTYAAYIAAKLGVNVTDTLGQIFGGKA